MAIDTNTSNAFSPTGEEKVAQDRPHSAFHGTTFSDGPAGAPTGSNDFLSLMSRISINQIDPTVEPYLKAVLAIVNEKMSSVTLENLSDRVPNAYAFKYDGPDGISHFFALYFAATGDTGGPNMYPASGRLIRVKDEIKRRYGTKARVHDGHVMISGYAPETERVTQMARAIIAVFNVVVHADIRNTTVRVLGGTEFVVDTNIAAVRYQERLLSPHGVPPRIDLGAVLKARIRQENARPGLRDEAEEYFPVGVIGGYMEIYDREDIMINGVLEQRFKPVFHITTMNSVIPLPAIGLLMLATIAQSIYQQPQFWARQWQDLGDRMPNPGMLLEDREKPGKPYILKDPQELAEFIRAYFMRPEISIQYLDGRDGIPGMLNMVSPDAAERNHFMRQLTNFFESEAGDFGNLELARIAEQRYDGVYGDSKGVLRDSRDIDYLYLAAKNGFASIDDHMRAILLGSAMATPTERAQLVSRATESFTPLNFNTIAIVNSDFIAWYASKMIQAGLVLTNPNAPTERRSLGSAIEGFGTTTNIPSVFTTMGGQRSGGYNSVWFQQ